MKLFNFLIYFKKLKIRILASLSHPNIISYKECFLDNEH